MEENIKLVTGIYNKNAVLKILKYIIGKNYEFLK